MTTVKQKAKEIIKEFDIGKAMKDLKEKQCKLDVDDRTMDNFYNICLNKFSFYKLTGQKRAAAKVMAYVNIVERERALVKAGINTFVYKKDIDDFIKLMKENKKEKNVLLWDLEDYERDIPEDVVNKLVALKEANLFEDYRILFTDYTGKEDDKLKKEKDPILFGRLKGASKRDVSGSEFDRYYFIADWVDEFCDLTLDKMVNIMNKEVKHDVKNTFTTPESKKEFDAELEKVKLAVETNTGAFALVNGSFETSSISTGTYVTYAAR